MQSMQSMQSMLEIEREEDNIRNAGAKGYYWEQNDSFINIHIPLEIWVDTNSIEAKFENDYINVGTSLDVNPLLMGHPYFEIEAEKSFWEIDLTHGHRILIINLKKTTSAEWPHLMKEDLSSNKLDSHSEYELAVHQEMLGNHMAAFERYLNAAKKGSISAHLKLAAVYAVEKHETKFELGVNLEESFKYHLKAAQLGSHEAEFFVGNSYQFGHGTKESFERAAYWYERFLNAKIPPNKFTPIALFNLGLIYHVGGTDLKPDQKKAYMWWMKGSEMGDAKSAFNLAILYLKGTGIEKDFNKAILLFQIAQELDPSLPIPEEIKKVISSVKEFSRSASPQNETNKTGSENIDSIPDRFEKKEETKEKKVKEMKDSKEGKAKKERKEGPSTEKVIRNDEKKQTSSWITSWEAIVLVTLVGLVVASFVYKRS